MKDKIFIVIGYEFFESIRNKWLIINSGLFFIFCWILFYLDSSEGNRAIVSILNLELLMIPLFSLIFGSLSFISSIPFLDVTLSRPLGRPRVFWGKWIGGSLSLSISFSIGLVFAAIFFTQMTMASIVPLLLLFFLGIILSSSFLSIAYLLSVYLKTRELVLVVSLLIWFTLYVLYDLFVLGFSVWFGDYPLEIPLAILIFLNPIDMARVTILMSLDIGNLMGVSAVVLQNLLSGFWRVVFLFLGFILWTLVPAYIAYRRFLKTEI